MSHRRIWLVLGLLVAATAARGAAMSVRFDSALTNTTQWVYAGGVRYSDEYRGVVFGTKDSQVISPELPFMVTSVTFRVRSASDKTTRQLRVMPTQSDAGDDVELLVRKLPCTGTYQDVTVRWTRSSEIRGFRVYSESGSGNDYLASAEILGADFLPQPEAPRPVNVRSHFADVGWPADAEVRSNRLDVAVIKVQREEGRLREELSFAAIENPKGNPVELSDTIGEYFPELSGENLFAPANSAGIVQISTTEKKGRLVYARAGGAGYEDETLLVTARRYVSSDNGRRWVPYTVTAGVTNELGVVELQDDFAEFAFALGALKADSVLVLPGTADGSRHRVQLTGLKFVSGYVPAGVHTNAVMSVGTRSNLCRLSPLEPGGRYLVWRTAYDWRERASQRSEPLEFRTHSGRGFAIRVR